uniref:Telomere length regulation protein TEL2 homolog n=1 Tax=Gasterosteus aculeatus aculeatus TaxID=481459 RepID=A0AAQ4PZ70_GASAC
MESLAPNPEVRLEVSRCFRTLATSTDAKDLVATLQTRTDPVQRAEFRRAHYTPALRLLGGGGIRADWPAGLTPAQQAELWDGLFLKGPPEQALLVLMEAMGEAGANLDRFVAITEKFLRSGRLADLLWSRCLETGPSDSPQLRETLLGRIAALPDVTANRLHLRNKALFLPQQYYPLLATEMLAALERTCQSLRDGTDCSLTFVAQTLGKVCIQGHSGLVLAVLAPRLSVFTRSDMVWQRVCWKLLQNVPQRWMESVLTGLVQAVSGPDALGRIIGNLVLTNKKAQFVITHKLLLLQYKYETGVLRIVLGYLAADRERRPLLIQVLRSVLQAWANPSAVKHTPLDQQLYVSKALLLSVSLLKDSELQELRSELLQCLLGGMQSHLDSGVVRVRRMGMVVGECLSARMDLNKTKLKFEVRSACQSRDTMLVSRIVPPSHLCSDDELTPYDMSGDQETSTASPPRYLRDCLETLVSSEDPSRVELSLRVAEGLVRRNIFAAREVSVQLTKVLLHMEDKYSISGFLSLRQATMVALTVTDSISVTQYLTTEFYSLNYSLRQRLDILEVLTLAAQELSKPIAETRNPPMGVSGAPESTPYPGDNPVHWREVVQKRIDSKTKRLRKGATQPPATATPNRYAPVAGHFFFPLLSNYDKPQVTFDLLGGDHLVLGRLIHSLGLLMHLAVNAPVILSMGCALLDFVWAVRYHADQMVRRGVLFAVCSVFLSMPSENLLVDLSDQLFETRTWLADVAEEDPDADCRSLAIQSLVLLDKSLKKQLRDQQALTSES